MKVLISAVACGPNRGSEPGVGWNWALQAARFHEVWVLTSVENREGIEREQRLDPRPNLHFIYHDVPRWSSCWRRDTRGLRLFLYLWELFALFPAYRAQRKIKFDVIHHVTLNSIETPGLLWLLPPPFIWGPVGGAQETPPVFREYFGTAWRGEKARAARKRNLKFNPMVRAAVRRSRLILVANRDTEKAIRNLGGQNIIRELETAIFPAPSKPIASTRLNHEPLRILWSGGLIPRKAPVLALDILELAITNGGNCHLTMVGDGEMSDEVRLRASEYPLSERVTLTGNVTHEEMQLYYDDADVFLFTSLNDTSGNVVLEAMSHEVPVIAFDHHGVAEIVTDKTGVKVSPRSPIQSIQEMADAILRLQKEPQLGSRMGAAGRARINSHFHWDLKGELISDIYQEATQMIG